jgi:hypothetical protein
MNIVCPCFLHLQSENKKQKMQWRIAHCSRNGRFIYNTITMSNKHFGPYLDNEAESTYAFYEIFCLE